MIRTGLPGRRTTILEHGGQSSVAELADIGAATCHADLFRDAVRITLALIAALGVDAAHLALRAARGVEASALLVELADVERAIARDAAGRHRAVARGQAGVVATPERADEGTVAVGVDEASLGNVGMR